MPLILTGQDSEADKNPVKDSLGYIANSGWVEQYDGALSRAGDVAECSFMRKVRS